ncbi:MAG: hypothetical protein K2H68_04255 [Bacteroidales bacterium]|nr:hypothetical protein [Bacteroidales bacterium]
MKLNEQKRLYRENALKVADFYCLPISRGLEITVTEGKSGETIQRIHKAMNRLAPMGEDERRSLWFEVKGKKWEWYRLSTIVYKDCHYLHISDNEHEQYVLADKSCENARRCYTDDELLDVLSRIENYVVNLIDNILLAPEQYNEYVDAYLDYHRRKGLIKRSIVNALLPTTLLDGIDIPRAIKIYESQQLPSQFPKMTLRNYMHYWRIAYEAVYGKQSGDDLDVFRHSSKGYETENYNLDSEEDFRSWKIDVSPFHGFDVVYARVHLYPVFENGYWHFRVGTSSYWNLDECLKTVLGLTDADIIPALGEVSHILGILRETDYVEITPDAYRYMQGEGVGSQMMLPYADEVGRDIIKKIIENTEWAPIERVRPANRI